MYTRAKVVNGIKGRTWTVRRTLMRDVPAGEDEPFEHDVDGGRIADMGIMSILVLLVVTLFAWFFPLDVIWPWYFWVPLFSVAAFFAIRWVLRLPWKLVADTQGDYDENTEAETWVGTVRGAVRARDEFGEIIKAIRKKDRPEYVNSVLKKQV